MKQSEIKKLISSKCHIYRSQDGLSKSMSEDGCLASVVAWFKLKWPQHSNLIYHIPNEGKHQSQKRENMGVLYGAPDLVIAIPRGGYGAYMFDAKKDTGYSISENQVKVINDMAEFNFAGYWHGVSAGKQSIIDYMSMEIIKNETNK